MRRIPTLLFLMAALAEGGWRPAPAQAPCPPAAELARTGARLQHVLDSLVQAYPDVPGASLAVIGRGGCLRWRGAAGVAHRGSGERLTPSHTHRIASNTKTYIAAAVLRLVEDGRLSLDDPLPRHVAARHVASLRSDGYRVDAITIRHLLTHRAGIYDYAMDDRFVRAIQANPAHRWSRTEQVDSAVAWGAPYGAPGDVFHYTDTGYILLGEIIERITGQGLASALRSLLTFDRLGLRSTWLETLEPVPSTAGPRAHQYMGTDDTNTFDASVDLFGGGGLVASPMDMAVFTRALLTGGVFRAPGTLDTMRSTMGSSTAPRVYAAGLGGIEVAGVTGWGHSGFWNTWSYHFPSTDVTLAASVTQQADRVVSRALLQLAAREVFPR